MSFYFSVEFEDNSKGNYAHLYPYNFFHLAIISILPHCWWECLETHRQLIVGAIQISFGEIAVLHSKLLPSDHMVFSWLFQELELILTIILSYLSQVVQSQLTCRCHLGLIYFWPWDFYEWFHTVYGYAEYSFNYTKSINYLLEYCNRFKFFNAFILADCDFIC